MNDFPELPQVPSIGERVIAAIARLSPFRSTGIRLMLAMTLFLILGAGWIRGIDTPEGLFGFMSVSLGFFFVVMVFAIRDFRKLMRSYVVEKENVFNDTMGDHEFVKDVRTGMQQSEHAMPWTSDELPALRQGESE